MPKAYSYLRFSRPEQAKGDSTRRQYEAAKRYAAENGLDLDDGLTFRDEGISAYQGKHLETGRLGDFLNEVKAGRVEPGSYLLVESLDRISRQSARKAQRILEDICEEGITVVTLIDGRKYDRAALDSDPMALILSLLTFLRAHEESATKAKRLKAAWANKLKNIAEKPFTSKAPHWLKLNKETAKFQVIEDRAARVREMFDLYLSGMGPSGIAKRYNQEGLAPWGRGQMWFESYIIKILANPAVYGVITPHKLEYDKSGKKKRVPLDPITGYYPVVVDEHTFLRAQELKTSKGVKGRRATVPLQNIFSGLGRCPVCDSAMVRVNKGKTFQYLACGAAKHGAKLCSYRSIPYYRLEGSFLEAVRAGLKIPVEQEKLKALEAELARAEANMECAVSQRRNLIEAIKVGALKEESITDTSYPQYVLTDIIEEGPVFREKWGPRTLRDEIEQLDEWVERDRKNIIKLRGQINLLRPAAVEARLKELEAAARAQTLDPQRFNAALQSICKKAVIEYDHSAVDLQFKHTDLVLRVPVTMWSGREGK
ncbi:hypothetical protein GMLC_21580 [Geomonas limicola]|uniref:Recombinase family protein n=1 Tax=Geomonas limicola TaxID=2740186 RepID=A0A6V8NBH9_9BACT|nr:recombinase family protein [Geomonas limicola]GFO68579.1 hypothetical protein GMLC_21580 [Geomonas limicola]